MPEPEPRPYFPSDDDRDWMKRQMEKLGITGQQLGDAVGLTRQAIYLIRDGVTKSTTEWPGIVRMLGGDPPSGDPVVLDDRLRKLIDKWPSLSEDDKRLIEHLADRLGLKKS